MISTERIIQVSEIMCVTEDEARQIIQALNPDKKTWKQLFKEGSKPKDYSFETNLRENGI